MAQFAVTDSAKKKIAEILKERNAKNGSGNNDSKTDEIYIRLEILGGGCSGFKYDFSVTSEKEKNDWCLEEDDTRLIIDNESIKLLSGAILDYENSLIGAAFKLTNPNASSSCGCGISFAL